MITSYADVFEAGRIKLSGNFIALFEAHKGERLTLTAAQGRVLLMLMKMFDDLARRLSGEWKRGAY